MLSQHFTVWMLGRSSLDFKMASVNSSCQNLSLHWVMQMQMVFTGKKSIPFLRLKKTKNQLLFGVAHIYITHIRECPLSFRGIHYSNVYSFRVNSQLAFLTESSLFFHQMSHTKPLLQTDLKVKTDYVKKLCQSLGISVRACKCLKINFLKESSDSSNQCFY